jgi:hypothetical protein
VPEAAVHEDSKSILGEHEIGLAREVRLVQPVAKTRAMNGFPDP